MQILNFVQLPRNSSLIATFSVYLPDFRLTMHKLKLMKTKQGYLLVSFPVYCVMQDDGSKKWEPYFEFSPEKRREFVSQVMEELKPFLTN